MASSPPILLLRLLTLFPNLIYRFFFLITFPFLVLFCLYPHFSLYDNVQTRLNLNYPVDLMLNSSLYVIYTYFCLLEFTCKSMWLTFVHVFLVFLNVKVCSIHTSWDTMWSSLIGCRWLLSVRKNRIYWINRYLLTDCLGLIAKVTYVNVMLRLAFY